MARMLKRESEKYRKKLIQLKERVIADIKHISEDTLNKSQKDASGDISGYTLHMADVATDSYDREFSLGLASNERDSLIKINEALKMIDEGKFGTCQICAKPISKTRLSALPFAASCLKCQRQREKR